MDTTYTVLVPEDKGGTRLDRLLADALPAFSRTRLKVLIEDGRVLRTASTGAGTVAVTDPALKVGPGQTYTVNVPPPTPARPEPQVIPLTVVYEDSELIVVDKPAGLVVHPAPGNPDRTLVNALLAHCGDSLSGIGGVGRPGIVHRLDKDTGGLMVVAKTDAAHHGLARQFAEHSMERAYHAVVWGRPAPRQGEISGNIGRSPRNRKKMAVVARGGKAALTRYRVLQALGTRASMVECRLATGRTHQIRVHMASIGHAVVGDRVYGGGGGRIKGLTPDLRQELDSVKYQALHAVLIGFIHPKSGEFLRFETKISNEINDLMHTLDKL